MIRFFVAFTTVVASSAAAIGYLALFSDEFDPRGPANLGAGWVAPMYRHWIEFVIIVWTTMATVGIGLYLALGARSGVQIHWPVVRRHLFRLHVISGAIILIGLFLAIVNGQPFQTRDAITALVGLSILAISALERPTPLQRKNSAIWRVAR
jgi:hypothetical protein